MITEITFITLILVELALFIYVFRDLDNRLYGNMFASGFGAILGGLLALWSFNGNIGNYETVINNTTTNATLGETIYTYTTQTTTLVDPTLGWLFLFWALIFALMLGFGAFEAWLEKVTPPEEEE